MDQMLASQRHASQWKVNIRGHFLDRRDRITVVTGNNGIRPGAGVRLPGV